MKFIKPTFVVFVFFFSAIFLRAEDPYANLPQGADPKDVGARIVDNYLKRPIDRHQSGIIYPEICAWYGALSYAKLASDGARTEKLIRRFDPVLAVASQEAKVIADPSQQAPSAASSKVRMNLHHTQLESLPMRMLIFVFLVSYL